MGDRNKQELNHVFRIGTVSSHDPSRMTVRVQIPDQDGLVSYDLPVVVRKSLKDKDYWLPDIGEQVVCLFQPHGQEQGVCLGAIYSKADAPPVQDKDKRHVLFEDGTWIEYDRKEHTFSGLIKGRVDDLVIEEEAVIEVKKTADITVHQDATVDSKQILYLKGKVAVQVRTPFFGIGPYDESGATEAVLETDILHRGDYHHEGDTYQTGDKLQVGNKLQTGNQDTGGIVEADILRGVLESGGGA